MALRRSNPVSGGKHSRDIEKGIGSPGEVPAASPADAVVLAVVGGAAPQRAMRLIEDDRVDRPRIAIGAVEGVSHPPQLVAHPLGRASVEGEASRADLV